MSAHDLQERRRADRVDEARGDSDIAIPKLLEMQRDRYSVHPDIRDVAAWRDDLLAQLEGCRNADRFDRGIDADAVRETQDRLSGLAVRAVHDARRTERLGDVEPLLIEVDHNDFGRRVELRR